MSAQTVIQGILSPKIVSDNAGGFNSTVDIVNVDTVTANYLNLASEVRTTGLISSGDVKCGSLTFNTGNGVITSSGNGTGKISLNAQLLDVNNSIIINSTGSVHFGSPIDTLGQVIKNSYGDVTFGSDIDMNGGTITTSGFNNAVKFGKDIDLNHNRLINTLTIYQSVGPCVTLGSDLDVAEQRIVSSSGNVNISATNINLGASKLQSGNQATPLNVGSNLNMNGNAISGTYNSSIGNSVLMGSHIDMGGKSIQNTTGGYVSIQGGIQMNSGQIVGLGTLNGCGFNSIQKFMYQQPSGTPGGNADSYYGTFNTYPLNAATPSLNTVASPNANILANMTDANISGIIPGGGEYELKPNQFLLYPDPTTNTALFRINATIPTFNSGPFACCLYDITNSNIVSYGTNAISGGLSILDTTVNITAPTVYDIRLRISVLSPGTTTDLGNPNTFGIDETYGTVVITQLPALPPT